MIIPTYNRADRLSSLLESWLAVDAFTSLKYELIFSDDGSNDQTLKILRSYQNQLPIRILSNQHQGPAEARNQGIAAAGGHRLLFLGDDIYPTVDLLDIHVSLGKSLGDHVAILGKVDWHPDQEQNHLSRHITEIGNEQFSYNVLSENSYTDFRHFYTCNVSVSNAMLATVSTKFDSRFYKANFEDIELAYRLSARGMKIYYAPAAFAHHFHEYDVEQFSRRQKTAGEMAHIFVKLHPELDHWLKLSNLKQQYHNFLQLQGEQIRPQRKLTVVFRKCRQIESELKSTPGNERKQGLLSLLYKQLFQLEYAAGVLSHSANYDECSAERFLYSRFFGFEFYNQLCGMELSADNDLRKITCVKLLQFYLRLLKHRLRPFQLGEASELICDSIRGRNVRPNLKQLALLKTKEYLRQFQLLRQLRQRLRSLSMEQLTRKVALEKPTASDIPCVAVLSEEAVSPARREAYHRELGAAILFVTKTERGYEFHSDGMSGVTGDLQTIDFSYILQVRSESELPRLFHFKNVLLSLAHYWYEYVMISYSYQSEPMVGIQNLSAQLFLQRNFFFARKKMTIRQGRVIRLLPAPEGVQEDRLETVLAGHAWECFFQNSYLNFKSSPFTAKSADEVSLDYLAGAESKPVVFVFPVILAVGGAERNLITVMRELQQEYHFVVITMAKHTQRQGSLHHQVEEITNDIYDLAEIASTGDFLKVLQSLKQKFNPQLLFITNGSPWLVSRSRQIRKLFAEIPIVDHQVYDQRAGWIEYYNDPGIQSFDRYVAINRKIQSVMEHEKGIAQERLQQIYHALDTGRIQKIDQSTLDPDTVCQKYGLPTAVDKYIFLARLNPQKRPLKFLQMLKLLQDSGREEFFVMVGDGELKQDVDDFICAAGLKNLKRIMFIENPLDLIAVCKGMIFTSAYEGLPVAMLEALSLGVPVFSTDVGDVKTVLDEYSAGLTIPVDCSTQDDVQYFNQFLVDRQHYAASLKTGRKQIIDRFSAECIASQFKGLFQESIQLKKGA
ncbi:glycosyltransferase [Gimesia panareensis]|uniref:glycosyltransferase n=1 Tax=Gimesia panareensis TaxID=2527978 RepID=UPI0018D7A5BE|nr:glycosyltransferase [Gimesia panareensis]